jgi:hypothetical protein
MRWHADSHTKDSVLRHSTDNEACKSFDNLHLEFSADSKNVRLGLTSDGFNSFGNLSTMSLILSLAIIGPSSPGTDIDVFLQPLIEELQEL